MSDAIDRSAIRRDALGIAVAAGVYAVSFGVISVVSGLTPLQTCVLSLVMFTGGSQFAFVGVLGSGGLPYSGVAAALLLGARNGLTASGWHPRSTPADRAGSSPLSS